MYLSTPAVAIWHIVIIVIIVALSAWAMRSACQQNPNTDDGSFEPFMDQLSFFTVGLVVSWIASGVWWWIKGWAELWRWGSTAWLLMAILVMGPPVLHAFTTMIRYPESSDTKWYEWAMPAALILIWLLAGQWLSAVVLVLVVIGLIALGIWEWRQLSQNKRNRLADGVSSGN